MIKELINWSQAEFKNLPWRNNRSLYTTLVSEIMLQQTTVQTVINHYSRFLKKYPSLDSLANCTEEELTIQWKGLGYYRRARNLHKACRYFQEKFNSKIPLNFDELIQAPGVGEYTANAILAIGADQNVLCVDANLERVLARLYNIKEEKGPKLIKKISKLFSEKKIASDIELYRGNAYNEALMDLGRVYCQARRADCLLCPMSDSCKSFKTGSPLSLPYQKEKIKMKYYDLKLLRLIVLKGDQLLCYKKSQKEWLSGQREIPTFVLESEDKELSQYPKLQTLIDYELLPMIKTSITKYRINNFVLICSEEEFFKITKTHHNKFEYGDLGDGLNLSTASTKSLNLVLSNS